MDEAHAPLTAPLLTVVIPVRNRAALVESTLRSVAAQRSDASFSLIVVDNGSTDGTPDVLRRLSTELRFPFTIISEPRAGAPRARNTGLAHVTTPWVMFFDSDDLMLPGHLARVLRGIAAHPEAQLLTFPMRATGAGIKPFIPDYTPSLPLHIARCTLSTQRMACRTDLVVQAGAWDVTLPGWDDWELGLRLLLQRPVAVKLTGEPTVDYILHPDSITGTGFSAHPERWELALDRAATLLASTPYMPLLGGVHATLAGYYQREGARARADARLRKAMEMLPRGRRWVARLIRAVVARTGHGGPLLSLMLLR